MSEEKVINLWEESINDIQSEDWPIKKKIEDLNQLQEGLKESQRNLSDKGYKQLAKKIIMAKIKLTEKLKKNIVKNFKIDNTEKEFEIKPPAGQVELLLPNMKTTYGTTGEEMERFALSIPQQKFWEKVEKQVKKAPPGFEGVNPKPRKKSGGRKRCKKRTRRRRKSRRISRGRKRCRKKRTKRRKSRRRMR
tara:strand:- start:2750 stop:3325 length:576 start_codon:yes stop_codon:yes gene_type:complete